MTKATEAYEAQGFPEAVGSTDVTHTSWGRVDASRVHTRWWWTSPAEFSLSQIMNFPALKIRKASCAMTLL